MSAMQNLYDTIGYVYEIGNHVTDRMPDGDANGLDTLTKLTSALQAATAEVQYSSIPEERKNQCIEKLCDYVREIIRGNMYSNHRIDRERYSDIQEYVAVIADNPRLSANTVSDTQISAKREDIITGVGELIKTLNDAAFDDLTKKALYLQLNGIRRICELQTIFSDEDVRVQVKLVMADVFAQWDEVVKQDEAFANKLKAWGARVLSGGSKFLGLTADISEVSGYLPPPGT